MRSLIPWSRREEEAWHPFRELDEWHRDLDELFSRAFGSSSLAPFAGTVFEGKQPAIETFARNGNLVVRMDVPGVDPKDVEINLTGEVLTVKGERKQREEKKEGDVSRTEIAYGSFQRSIRLPGKVDAAAVKASYENGVLEITLPAPKEVEAKKIPVEAAAKK